MGPKTITAVVDNRIGVVQDRMDCHLDPFQVVLAGGGETMKVSKGWWYSAAAVAGITLLVGT